MKATENMLESIALGYGLDGWEEEARELLGDDIVDYFLQNQDAIFEKLYAKLFAL